MNILKCFEKRRYVFLIFFGCIFFLTFNSFGMEEDTSFSFRTRGASSCVQEQESEEKKTEEARRLIYSDKTSYAQKTMLLLFLKNIYDRQNEIGFMKVLEAGTAWLTAAEVLIQEETTEKRGHCWSCLVDVMRNNTEKPVLNVFIAKALMGDQTSTFSQKESASAVLRSSVSLLQK